MAEHRELCEASEASTYCMNGGTCYQIPSVSTLTCVCASNFKGSRCEEFQLFQTSKTSGLITALVILACFILVVLIMIIYYTCRMWKKRDRNNSRAEYGRARPV